MSMDFICNSAGHEIWQANLPNTPPSRKMVVLPLAFGGGNGIVHLKLVGI